MSDKKKESNDKNPRIITRVIVVLCAKFINYFDFTIQKHLKNGNTCDCWKSLLKSVKNMSGHSFIILSQRNNLMIKGKTLIQLQVEIMFKYKVRYETKKASRCKNLVKHIYTLPELLMCSFEP